VVTKLNVQSGVLTAGISFFQQCHEKSLAVTAHIFGRMCDFFWKSSSPKTPAATTEISDEKSSGSEKCPFDFLEHIAGRGRR
jgi:hypothetical protein